MTVLECRVEFGNTYRVPEHEKPEPAILRVQILGFIIRKLRTCL